MAVLTVDDKNTSLSYLDSGPPESESNYVTLFILHGHTFHSPIFKPLFPLAPKYNIRVVAVTRRDYNGSTPFTPAELEIITQGDIEAKTGFLQERAGEIAIFIDKFIHQYKLPKASEDGAQGGIALLGWSLGNVQAMSVVGLAQHLRKGLVDRLEPYFRRFLLYECPYHSLGFVSPQRGYHPLRDPSIPEAEKVSHFGHWVSGYFKHGGLDSRDPSALEYITPSNHRLPTTAALSQEELDSVIDTAPGPRSEDPFVVCPDPRLLGRIREEVFFPSKVIWPKLTVKAVWGTESTWSIPYASWELERFVQLTKSQSPDRWQRPLAATPIDGVNHFAHWDDPETLMQVFANVLSS